MYTIKNVKYATQYCYAATPAHSGTPVYGMSSEAYWHITAANDDNNKGKY
jgi:hypothetical protein